MKFYVFIIIITILSIFWIIFFSPMNFPFYDIYARKNNEWEKMQWVRLLDILILGPFGIWLGYKLQYDNKSWGIIPYLLYFYGFSTIVYNFANYYRNKIHNN